MRPAQRVLEHDAATRDLLQQRSEYRHRHHLDEHRVPCRRRHELVILGRGLGEERQHERQHDAEDDLDREPEQDQSRPGAHGAHGHAGRIDARHERPACNVAPPGVHDRKREQLAPDGYQRHLDGGRIVEHLQNAFEGHIDIRLGDRGAARNGLIDDGPRLGDEDQQHADHHAYDLDRRKRRCDACRGGEPAMLALGHGGRRDGRFGRGGARGRDRELHRRPIRRLDRGLGCGSGRGPCRESGRALGCRRRAIGCALVVLACQAHRAPP